MVVRRSITPRSRRKIPLHGYYHSFDLRKKSSATRTSGHLGSPSIFTPRCMDTSLCWEERCSHVRAVAAIHPQDHPLQDTCLLKEALDLKEPGSGSLLPNFTSMGREPGHPSWENYGRNMIPPTDPPPSLWAFLFFPGENLSKSPSGYNPRGQRRLSWCC